jgi:ubiquinone/menaquinone biosynthesis C-methylase UbiE
MTVVLEAGLEAKPKWQPNLDGERVVEGIHYGWLMRDHLARYEYAAQFCKGKRVLDVATGTGYGANILRRAGAAEVVAVDREQGALDYAEQRYGTDGLRWVNGNAYELPFEREFDVVISFETIEHLKEPERFVRECKRVAKPGGQFIVSTPENVGGPLCSEFHEFEYNRREFREVLERNFPRVELMGQRRELSMVYKPLGDLPGRYWWNNVRQGRGSQIFFTFMDRINKAPNQLLAWANGYTDKVRSEIRPIEAPLQLSRLLKPHYFVMLGICVVD